MLHPQSPAKTRAQNWFQNRRAKSKQDAKKQAGALNLFAHPQSSSLTLSSDSDTSPAFPSADYFQMMSDTTDQPSHGANVDQMDSMNEQALDGLPLAANHGPHDQYHHSALPHSIPRHMFDSPQELNRRTLTQEQFDAFAVQGGEPNMAGQFDALQNGFAGDTELFSQVFPDVNQMSLKQPDAFHLPFATSAPMSSNDSSVPSSLSEQSMFPASSNMQERTMSATSSEWPDSRGSSVSTSHHQDHHFHHHHHHHQLAPQQHQHQHQQPVASSSQWQPGQSVPVDPNQLQQQFREAAQLQQQRQQQMQQIQAVNEQPLAWPSDEAYLRRDSQSGSLLAQQMSSFAIQTPQPPSTATFKSPAPLGEAGGSIAARRQRPRPAALGLASLRSQSHSGAVQPSSPGQQQQVQNLAPGQQLRRIRSSNVINGVAQGRVMKSTPGSAQRSPLNFTFAETMGSPKAVRHASTSSSGNLAPPTPMSPSEGQIPRQEPTRSQFPPWQPNSNQFGHHASISETDTEHSQSNVPVNSPPHTPMYQPKAHEAHRFAPGPSCNPVITENTPPQSAPAAQQTFPTDLFAMPQYQTQNQHFVPSQQQQQQQFINAPEQQFHAPAATYAPAQHFQPVTSRHVPMQFSNGVPVVDAQGNLTLAFPAPTPVQQMPFIPHTMPSAQTTHHHQTPQGLHYNFMTTAGVSPSMQVTAHLPKRPSQPADEFFVHEYSPPQDLKRSATVRKSPADTAPKNYTFANQGPEHFERKAREAQDAKTSGTASSSPASGASSS